MKGITAKVEPTGGVAEYELVGDVVLNNDFGFVEPNLPLGGTADRFNPGGPGGYDVYWVWDDGEFILWDNGEQIDVG